MSTVGRQPEGGAQPAEVLGANSLPNQQLPQGVEVDYARGGQADTRRQPLRGALAVLFYLLGAALLIAPVAWSMLTMEEFIARISLGDGQIAPWAVVTRASAGAAAVIGGLRLLGEGRTLLLPESVVAQLEAAKAHLGFKLGARVLGELVRGAAGFIRADRREK